MLAEIMTQEKRGLLAVLCTLPAERDTLFLHFAGPFLSR